MTHNISTLPTKTLTGTRAHTHICVRDDDFCDDNVEKGKLDATIIHGCV